MEDKVLSDLQVAIRTDRLKQQSIEKFILSLERKKTEIDKDIASLKATKEALTGEISEIRGKKDGLLNDLKVEASNLASEKELFKAQKKELLAIRLDNDKVLEEAKREQEKNKLSAENIKSERSNLNKARIELEKEKETLKKHKVDIKLQLDEVGVARREYQDKLKDLSVKTQEIGDNFLRAKRVKDTLDTRLNEAEKMKIQLQGEINKSILLQEETKKINEGLASFRDREKELEQTKLSFEKMIEEQSKKEAEIEIRRLRVEKLARDKSVLKELKDLEDELGAK